MAVDVRGRLLVVDDARDRGSVRLIHGNLTPPASFVRKSIARLHCSLFGRHGFSRSTISFAHFLCAEIHAGSAVWPPLFSLYLLCAKAEQNEGAHVYADVKVQQKRMPPAQARAQDGPPALVCGRQAPSSYSLGVAPAPAASGQRAEPACCTACLLHRMLAAPRLFRRPYLSLWIHACRARVPSRNRAGVERYVCALTCSLAGHVARAAFDNHSIRSMAAFDNHSMAASAAFDNHSLQSDFATLWQDDTLADVFLLVQVPCFLWIACCTGLPRVKHTAVRAEQQSEEQSEEQSGQAPDAYLLHHSCMTVAGCWRANARHKAHGTRHTAHGTRHSVCLLHHSMTVDTRHTEQGLLTHACTGGATASAQVCLVGPKSVAPVSLESAEHVHHSSGGA